jgi:hypothetical protein
VSDGGRVITTYKIYLNSTLIPVFTLVDPVLVYFDLSGSTSATPSQVSSVTATVNGLNASTAYHFKVVPVNLLGDGPTSSASAAGTTLAAQPPGPPSELQALDIYADRAFLKWNLLSTGGVPCTFSVIVQAADPGAFTNGTGTYERIPQVVSSGVTYGEYKLVGLHAATEYNIYVYANNTDEGGNIGAGPVSGRITFTTGAATLPGTLRRQVRVVSQASFVVPPLLFFQTFLLLLLLHPLTHIIICRPPLSPPFLSAYCTQYAQTRTTPESVNLTWTPPDFTGGTSIYSYRIDRRRATAIAHDITVIAAPSATAATALDDSTDPSTATFKVGFTGNTEAGALNNYGTQTTYTPCLAYNVTAADMQTALRTLLAAYAGNGAGLTVAQTITYVHSDYPSASNVSQWRVTGANLTSQFGGPIHTFEPVPCPTTGNPISSSTSKAIATAWADTRSQINANLIELSSTSPLEQPRSQMATPDEFVEHAIVRGLEGNNIYVFYVSAVNAQGMLGAAETESTGSYPVLTSQPVVPGALPQAPRAILTEQIVNITWQSALGITTTGGSTISGYKIEMRKTFRTNTSQPENDPWTDSCCAAALSSTDTNFVISNLETAYAYSFRVSVVNTAVGAGPASPPSIMTPVASQRPSQITPAPQISNSTPTTLILSWPAPASDGGAFLEGYRIYSRKGGTGTFATLFGSTNSTVTNATIVGLEANEIYEFKVSAINAAGLSVPSLASGVAESSVAVQIGLMGVTEVLDSTAQTGFINTMSSTTGIPTDNIAIASQTLIDDGTGSSGRRMVEIVVQEEYASSHLSSAEDMDDHLGHGHGHGRRLAVIGVNVEINISLVTASDASSAQSSIETAIVDNSLGASLQSAGINTTSTTQQANATSEIVDPTSTTSPPEPAAGSVSPPAVGNITAGGVDLDWEAPTNNGGAEFTGYRIAAFSFAAEQQRVVLLENATQQITKGGIRLGYGAGNFAATCLDAVKVTNSQFKAAVEKLDNSLSVTVTSDSSTTVLGKPARTWTVTFNAPTGDVGTLLSVDVTGCTDKFDTEIDGGKMSISQRLYATEWVKGAVKGASPDVLIDNTGTASTSLAGLSGLRGETSYSFVVAGINSAGLGAYGAESATIKTLAPANPGKIEPAPVVSNVSTTSLNVAWSIPANNGLPIRGYEIRGTRWRREIQAVAWSADSEPVAEGAAGGTFRVVLNASFASDCVPWDVSAAGLMSAMNDASVDGNAFAPGAMTIVNVTRRNASGSVGFGYVWSVTFGTDARNVGDLNATQSTSLFGHAACSDTNPMTVGFSKQRPDGSLQPQLSARTIIDGQIETAFVVTEDTESTETAMYIYSGAISHITHSSVFAFSVRAIHAGGFGVWSDASQLAYTLSKVDCLLSEFGPWSDCTVLHRSRKQCGELVCRLTSCGTRVCGRRMCKSVDITRINFAANPNATAGFVEIDTESFQNRTRFVLEMPTNGGLDCELTLTQTRPCCTPALLNKAIEVGGVRSVCNGTVYVPKNEMPAPTEESGSIRVVSDTEIVADSATCGEAAN